MPPTPSLAAFDRALLAVAGLAAASPRLSAAERRELAKLAAAGGNSLTMADRARCAGLIRKAAPETLPDVRIPPRLRKLLRPDPAPRQLRGPAPTVDPLDRLVKLGRLRGTVLSEAQFEGQRARILADPAIGAFGAAEGVDPLDRLTQVGALEAAEILEPEQAARLTEQILDAG